MSRINLNLREDKQWSYGARTGLASARGQRFFYITTGVQSDKTAESIQEVMKELRAYIGDSPVTEEELANSISNNTLSLPGRWETAGSVLGSLSQIVQYGLDDDYFDTFADDIRSLKTEEVARVSKKLIHPDSLVWVVVGDRKMIEPALNELGFGKVRVINSEGEIQE